MCIYIYIKHGHNIYAIMIASGSFPISKWVCSTSFFGAQIVSDWLLHLQAMAVWREVSSDDESKHFEEWAMGSFSK